LHELKFTPQVWAELHSLEICPRFSFWRSVGPT